jgi:hypothetical protein
MSNPKAIRCQYHRCIHGYLDQSKKNLEKNQRRHVLLYHEDQPLFLGFKGAQFTFKRDSSRDMKYVCPCEKAFPNPYTLRQHIQGDGKDHKPCRVVGFLLKDIAAGKMTRDSNTISFGPSQSSRGEADEPNVQEPEETENEEDEGEV